MSGRAARTLVALVLTTSCATPATSGGLGAPTAAPAVVTSPQQPEAEQPSAASRSTALPTGVSSTATAALPLTGQVVVLDPGHNGRNHAHPELINALVEAGGFRKPCNTTGTATATGYAESAFALDVALRTATLLRTRGAVVALTRETDDGVGPCVDQRAALGNMRRAALAVSVHADGAPPGARGFHVIEPGLAPDGGNAGILGRSRALAAALHAALVRAGRRPATYPADLVAPGLTRRDDLAGLNLSRVPAALVECGNMRDSLEAVLMQDEDWRQATAVALADGITAHLTA